MRVCQITLKKQLTPCVCIPKWFTLKPQKLSKGDYMLFNMQENTHMEVNKWMLTQGHEVRHWLTRLNCAGLSTCRAGCSIEQCCCPLICWSRLNTMGLPICGANCSTEWHCSALTCLSNACGAVCSIEQLCFHETENIAGMLICWGTGNPWGCSIELTWCNLWGCLMEPAYKAEKVAGTLICCCKTENVGCSIELVCLCFCEAENAAGTVVCWRTRVECARKTFPLTTNTSPPNPWDEPPATASL